MLGLSSSPRRRRFSLLALPTLAVSLLLHLALLRSVASWDVGKDVKDAFLAAKPVVIQLQAAQESAKPAQAPPAARKRRTPVKRKAPKPSPAPEVASPSPAIETSPLADAGSNAISNADTAPAAQALGQPADTPAAEQLPPAKPESESTSPTPTRASPPPSALLSYSVQAKRSEGNVEGTGSIRFTRNQDSYRVDGEVKALFMSLLNFQSEGQIEPQGLAPVIYTEKRFRKSATNTHFQRERQVVSFSASTTSYPRTGMEQDRASIVWQLAALGRGDAAQLAPGAELDIFVAGIRDGDVWHLQVVGEEDMQVAGQSVRALHVLRQPRAGSYDQKLDIWLAPALQWYPVKLRFTEANGDVLDLTLNDLQQAPVGN